MAEYDSSITAFFGGDTSGLAKAITGAETMVGKFQSTLSGIGISIGAGTVIGFFKSVVDHVSKIQDMSDALGVNTTALQSFSFAVEKAGGKANDAAMLWRTAKKNLDELADGNEKTAETFKKLHLKASDFIGLELDQKLEKIAKAYVENKDKAGAYAAFIDIVGAKSAKLTAVLENLGRGGWDPMNESAARFGGIIGPEAIKQIDAVGDSLTRLKVTGLAWGAQFLSQLEKMPAGMEAVMKVAIKVATALNDTAEQRAANSVKLSKKITVATAEQLGPLLEVKEIMEQSIQVSKEANVVEKDRIEALEKVRKVLAQNADDELSYAKLRSITTRALTTEELVQIEIHKKKNELILVEAQLKDLLKDGYDALSDTDKKRVAELLKQSKVLETQITQKTALIAGAKGQAAAEATVTAELKAQEAVTFGRKGQDPEDLSDIQLSSAKTRLKKQLAQLTQEDASAAAGSAFLGPSYKSPMTAGLEAELKRINNEQELRRDFSMSMNRKGRDVTEALFTPTSFDRLTALYGDQSIKQTEELVKIGSQLKNIFGGG